ncbi:MAG: AAA family ATPase [Phycisphaerae bacterium]|nr:AAA family ATPase [Phycisphaerae bacterium]
MKTIAIVNQKGGCGKTTISINLASALAELGNKTLLVDMDPQSHCAVGLAVPEEQIEQSIYDVLISSCNGESLKLTETLWQINENLDLAPSSIDLSAFEQQMNGMSEKENALMNVLDQVKDQFDYTIIDCPPAVGLLTFNALRAADEVVVPVETGYFALHGLSKQLETLNILCQRFNQKIDVRVLASMYDIRTKMAREILAELRNHFADKMFSNAINFNTKIKEAASFGQPICEYAPSSKGKRDFELLAKSIVEQDQQDQNKQLVNSLSDQLSSLSTSADDLALAVNDFEKDPETIEVEEELKKIDEEISKYISGSPEQLLGDLIDINVENLDIIEDEAQQDLPTTEDKLTDYYGVNQINKAVYFVTLYPKADLVQIAGDFNNWVPEETGLEKAGKSGIWQTKLKLSPGKYRYRLVVDGKWQQDPYNEKVEMNPYGDFNSIVEVN